MNTNYFFKKGKVSFVMDGSAGSSGKSLLSSLLVGGSTKVDFLMSSFTPNASHTITNDDGTEFVFKIFAGGSQYHEKLKAVYIVDNSAIELEQLWKEIEYLKIPHSKVRISPRCGVVQQIDKDFEAGLCDLDGNYYSSDELGDGTVNTGCFEENTMILMGDGTYKRIVDVEPNDMVINMLGKPVKVLRRINNGVKEMVKMKNSVWPDEYFVTPNHQFYMGDLSGLKKRNGVARNILTRKDRMAWFPISSSFGNRNFLPLTPSQIDFNFDDVPETSVVRIGDVEVPVGYSLGYFLGYFLGDGCANKDGRVFFYCDAKHDNTKLLHLLGSELEFSVSTYCRKNQEIFVIRDKSVAEFLQKFGKKSKKYLPKGLMFSDDEYLSGLFDGLNDSDGHKTERGSHIFCTTSADLHCLYTTLCLHFGIPIGSYLPDKSLGDKDYDAENCAQPIKISTVSQNRTTNGYWYSTVKSYENQRIQATAWDLEVDCETHSFVANGVVVHNSTCSGSGTVLARKVVRNKKLKTAKDFPELAQFLYPMSEIIDRLEAGDCGLYEIAQGFPLSMNHHRFAPYTTSRNVTVSSALNDAMLSPKYCGNVFINWRTLPIKIHSKKYKDKKTGLFLTWDEVQTKTKDDYDVIESYSGDFYPDQTEISWEEVTKMAKSDTPIMEVTTLTKLPRRISTFSKMNLEEAIKFNRTGNTTYLCINFMNYICAGIGGKRSLLELTPDERTVIQNWIDQNIKSVIHDMDDVKIKYIGTGKRVYDKIEL